MIDNEEDIEDEISRYESMIKESFEEEFELKNSKNIEEKTKKLPKEKETKIRKSLSEQKQPPKKITKPSKEEVKMNNKEFKMNKYCSKYEEYLEDDDEGGEKNCGLEYDPFEEEEVEKEGEEDIIDDLIEFISNSQIEVLKSNISTHINNNNTNPIHKKNTYIRNEITQKCVSNFEKITEEDFKIFSRSNKQQDIVLEKENTNQQQQYLSELKKNGLKFQITGIDYKSNVGNGENYYNIFGVTEDSKTVMLESYGFYYYYYITLPNNSRKYQKKGIFDLNLFKSDLNDDINKLIDKKSKGSSSSSSSQNLEDFSSIKDSNMEELVINIEHKSLKDIKDAKSNKKINLLKLTFKYHSHNQKIQELLKENYGCKLYESDITPSGRYVADMDIYGGSWGCISSEVFEKSGESILEVQQKSRSTLNLKIKHTDLIRDNTEKKIAPYVSLIYDIECISGSNHFPKGTNEEDPIVLISNFILYPDNKTKSVVFVLGDCTDVNKNIKEKEKHTLVKNYKDEKSLLRDWISFFKMVDPDFTSGYNNAGFDLPYIHDRCQILKLEREFQSLGRIGNNAKKRSITSGSKQTGKNESNQVKLTGVIELDMLSYIKKKKNFSSYTLEYVSNHYLKDNKLKVHHTYISKLFHGSDEQRKILTEYCIKDSELVVNLILKLNAITEVIGMARVTKINVQDAISSGQQIRFKGLLLDLIRSHNLGYVCPTNFSKISISYKGGRVFEPIPGFYINEPVITLDFQSLYPSIMIEHNLCYTTLIDLKYINTHKLVEGVDYTKTPNEQYFLMVKHRQGILPLLLKILLGERARVKNEQKRVPKTDAFWAVLEGEQLAYKVSANSIYGATGFSCGFLPCLEIAASVTAFARHHITQAKNFVEEMYPQCNVIYGDTDSIMVRVPGISLEESLSLGVDMSAYVTDRLNIKKYKAGEEVLNLQFEKVYSPYLLMGKKKYVGKKYTLDTYKKTKLPDSEFDGRGVESVRRDNTQFTRDLMNIMFKALFTDQVPIEQLGSIIKPHIEDLLEGRVDISKLIITNSISKPISSYDGNVTHIEVAKKLRTRVPENPPMMGDRIRYSIIKIGNKKTKTFECAECPDHIVENNLQIDYEKIYRSKVLPPIERVLYVIYNHLAMKKNNSTTKRINELLKKLEDTEGLTDKEREKKHSKIMQEIMLDSKKYVDKILNVFRVKKGIKISDISTTKQTGLLKFGFTVIKCLVCNKGHSNKNSKTCTDCQKQGEETIKRLFLQNYESASQEIEKMKQTCFDCQKQFEIKQECGNYDCNHGIYYRRITKDKEYKNLSKRKDILKF
jgi:DNA polymerase delta subunit 1